MQKKTRETVEMLIVAIGQINRGSAQSIDSLEKGSYKTTGVKNATKMGRLTRVYEDS